MPSGTPSRWASSSIRLVVDSKPQVVRDPDYYFQNIIFFAEDRLFKVPSIYFRSESEFFRDMFELPPPKDRPVDGTSDEHPLVLEGITSAEFGALLRLMFPRTWEKYETLSVDEWKGVLKLSDMWGMSNFKHLAIKHITNSFNPSSSPPTSPTSPTSATSTTSHRNSPPITPTELITLARRYHVPQWLLPAYTHLIQRANPIQLHEAAELGFETALKICAIRESVGEVPAVVNGWGEVLQPERVEIRDKGRGGVLVEKNQLEERVLRDLIR